jgi:hypothetical protein
MRMCAEVTAIEIVMEVRPQDIGFGLIDWMFLFLISVNDVPAVPNKIIRKLRRVEQLRGRENLSDIEIGIWYDRSHY